MSAPDRPPLKSITPATDGPRAAVPTPPPAAVGEPKGAARKGDRTAVVPDPHPGDGRRPVAWLHIVAPRGAVPTATSRCACGRDRSAVGHAKVHALITEHNDHREHCPLRNPQEGRAAA
ncbi:hypothetical protein QFZ63_003769 [Streptomyces sp. B3I7]|uniref:hypothetical protein n=1 Tax=Streptomyces sp. B3I7 TaxID=3042269 RepID=UPI00277FA6A8|nr:hypothetical protein [Streptomyces sp. B3I7]MDQ0812055.1 hypothetical protein [Streptomyces sp. B3I7]